MTNLDKIAKEYLSSKICGKCSMYEECDKGQVSCIDVEIFKGGYKTCMKEWHLQRSDNTGKVKENE